MKICPGCGSEIPDNVKFCTECGFNILAYENKPKKQFCPECGTEVTEKKFCPECGFSLISASPIGNGIGASDTGSDRGGFGGGDIENSFGGVGSNVGGVGSEGGSLSFGVSGGVGFSFTDDWLDGIADETDTAVLNKMIADEEARLARMLAPFDYEKFPDDTYGIIALKQKNALRITVPDGVVIIGADAFSDSAVISVTLPVSLVQISDRAFKNCMNLEDIVLPSTLMVLGD